MSEGSVTGLSSKREVIGLASDPPEIELGRMLRTHGYRQLNKTPGKVLDEARKAYSKAQEYACPQSFYCFLKVVDLRDGRLVLEDGTIFRCPAFDFHLRGCTKVCVFVTTLGQRLDVEIGNCFEEAYFQPLEALFLGTFGWLMIEAITRDLIRLSKIEQAKNGCELTLRMGPGYMYRMPDSPIRAMWDLREQEALLGVFEDAELPVQLTSGCSMTPAMSRSGLVGVRKNNATRNQAQRQNSK